MERIIDRGTRCSSRPTPANARAPGPAGTAVGATAGTRDPVVGLTWSDPAQSEVRDLHERPAELLQRLLRFDTTNPPGAERECVEWLAGLLGAAGLERTFVAADPARPSVVARLLGSGDAPPLMLRGHVDVVATTGQQWTHPPFASELADGFVWGRGALDMKGGVAMFVAGPAPQCPSCMVAVADRGWAIGAIGGRVSGAPTRPRRRTGWLGQAAAVAVWCPWILSRLWVAVISRQSERQADLPRRWKRSMRRLNFVCANTGSIIALRLR
jgi:Peptidase family M20/M25/M40